MSYCFSFSSISRIVRNVACKAEQQTMHSAIDMHFGHARASAKDAALSEASIAGTIQLTGIRFRQLRPNIVSQMD